MTSCLYFFETHTIQPFIFESGRLAEMVGASDLIEDLLGGILDSTLRELGIPVSSDSFLRRGGGAFILQISDKQQGEFLRDLWGLIVYEKAPGLAFSHTVVTGDTIPGALKEGRKKLLQLRNHTLPRLPVAGPLIKRAPRTGNPAVRWGKVKKNRWEWIDAATEKKREDKYSKGKTLQRKFLADTKEDLKRFTFPLNLDPDEDNAFPFESDNHYVAIIHADGNGIGQQLIALGEKLQNDPEAKIGAIFREFSTHLKEATEVAAKEALRAEIKKNRSFTARDILPFRPLVLGGDDLTVIIRSEFALSFTKRFIELFERETKSKLAQISHDAVPKGLTACAGVCFVKVNYPFYLGYQLAESLCKHAKDIARRACSQNGDKIPSAIIFHRVTTSFVKNYKTVLNEEMKAGDNNYLTMGAYGVGEVDAGLPPLAAIMEMKELFQKPAMARGPVRHFLSLLHTKPAVAAKVYQRWLENMKKRKELQSYLEEYEKILTEIFTSAAKVDNLPFQKMSREDACRTFNRNCGTSTESRSDEDICRTFIGDLTQLIAVEGEAHDH